MENSLAGIRAKTTRLAELPVVWLAEREDLLVENYSDSVEGESYQAVLTSSVWVYLLYSYLALVREHFGDEIADAVWANQQAMLEAEAAGAASAISLAFGLIESALQAVSDVIPPSRLKTDIPTELGVALVLLLGLPDSPGYRAQEDDGTTDKMPPGIDWFLSTQLLRGREQIHLEFEPLFRADRYNCFSQQGDVTSLP